MGEKINRDELDKRMEAYRLYVDEGWSLESVAKQFHTRHERVKAWVVSLGGTIRPRSVYERSTRAAIDRAERASVLKPGETICECGLIYTDDGSGACPTCSNERERETEREAELALFSDAAFLDNPRNLKKFDRSKVRCLQGVIPVW